MTHVYSKCIAIKMSAVIDGLLATPYPSALQEDVNGITAHSDRCAKQSPENGYVPAKRVRLYRPLGLEPL